MRVATEDDFPLIVAKFNQSWCSWAPNADTKPVWAYIQCIDSRTYNVKRFLDGEMVNEVSLARGQVFQEIVFPAQFLNFGNVTLLIERTTGNTFRGLLQKFITATHVPSSWARIVGAAQSVPMSSFFSPRSPPVPEVLDALRAPCMSMASVQRRLAKVPECALSEHFCVTWSLDSRNKDDYWIWSHHEPIGCMLPRTQHIIIKRPSLRQEFIDLLRRGGERNWEVE